VVLRRQMRTQAAAHHDWASIVAYASFPPSFDTQLRQFRNKQAQRRLEAAFHHADRMLSPWDEKTSSRRSVRPPDDEELRRQRERLDRDRNHLESLLAGRETTSTSLGLLASSEKRLAQILWRMKEAAESSFQTYREQARDSLIKSRRYYYEAFQKDRQPWALVQALVLTLVLKETIQCDDWELARILSKQELKSAERRRVAWANANLMELYLIASKTKDLKIPADEPKRQTARYTQEFIQATDDDVIELYSTRRQLLRYSGFFIEVNPGLRRIAEQATKLAKLLPESRTFT
jgi:hypothetical protein